MLQATVAMVELSYALLTHKLTGSEGVQVVTVDAKLLQNRILSSVGVYMSQFSTAASLALLSLVLDGEAWEQGTLYVGMFSSAGRTRLSPRPTLLSVLQA